MGKFGRMLCCCCKSKKIKDGVVEPEVFDATHNPLTPEKQREFNHLLEILPRDGTKIRMNPNKSPLEANTMNAMVLRDVHACTSATCETCARKNDDQLGLMFVASYDESEAAKKHAKYQGQYCGKTVYRSEGSDNNNRQSNKRSNRKRERGQVRRRRF